MHIRTPGQRHRVRVTYPPPLVLPSYVSGLLEEGENEQGVLVIGASFTLTRVTTSGKARVRIYESQAQADADLDRSIYEDPTGDHGVVLDVVTDFPGYSVELDPTAPGSASSPPITVTNLDVTPAAITVTLAGTVG